MLSSAAFNAFLKTLEEPPAHAIFILATTEKHKILPTILSRCQIYDFNRMEVNDIVAHLKSLSNKEGYQYEEEALNVIARKADGGMRDALSIFDQVASYTGGNITYQKVIEDLNVLDEDYYFKMTDELLAADVPSVMLTFHDILSKGFEANHFIGGLASHFRNLLVSRDPQTLILLETSESIKQKYSEQAQKCRLPFLYKALRLCNECDINYRTSRNKRLLVEIVLIEVAQAAEEDSPGCGLGPTKKLKPIFNKTHFTK
jgi:DNA polymerase-3 subunit gamma/tau